MMKEAQTEELQEISHEVENTYNVPNLEKGLLVLELLSESGNGLTLQEVRNSLKISLTTAYRILNTLVRMEYLMYQESTKKYILSRKMLTIGFRSIHEHNVMDLILPRMRELRDEIKESVFFGVLGQDSITVLEKSVGTYAFCFYLNSGHKVALHCSAPGKAMLAALPADIRDQYLSRIKFEIHNENTISNREQLEKELEVTLQRGYGLDLEEEMSGVICIGAAILDFAGLPCGCLWTSAPKDRMKQRNIEKIGKQLGKITREISMELGYQK
ncbi:MAG: IclR family transcriptional regulator [Bacteroidales bacterium]